MNEWQPNTGVVPEDIDSSTQLRVRYRDGYEGVNDGWCFPGFWEIHNDSCDVVEWRIEQ